MQTLILPINNNLGLVSAMIAAAHLIKYDLGVVLLPLRILRITTDHAIADRTKGVAVPELNVITVGGIPTVVVTRAGLADLMVQDSLLRRSLQPTEPKLVFASNGSVISTYHAQQAFRDLIERADIIDADGMSLVLASRLLCKTKLPERVATTDFIHDAAKAASAFGVKFYFLGGRPGVADMAAERLQEQFPGLDIVGTRNGYFSDEQVECICAEIVERGTDVLWLGLGTPLQERFAVEYRHLLKGVAWIRTCGGLFDHCAGNTKRAPVWIQNLGFEWAFRVAQEPRRLSMRYLKTNPRAAVHLLTKTSDLAAV